MPFNEGPTESKSEMAAPHRQVLDSLSPRIIRELSANPHFLACLVKYGAINQNENKILQVLTPSPSAKFER